jgi:hypothetical protein
MKISKKILIASIITVSALVGGAYAATVLLTQSFPTVTIPPSVTITGDTACGTGNLLPQQTPTANSGTIEFDCGSTSGAQVSSLYAFSVSAAAGVTSGTLTPTFTIPITSTATPAPTASVGIVTTGEGNCGTATTITSGTAVTFGTGGLPLGDYNYCLTYSGFDGPGGSIGTFSVSWSSQ